MANSFITDDVIAKVVLYNLENQCVMTDCVYKGHVKEFVKKGASVRIEKPLMLLATNGKVRSNQDLTEGSITLTVDQQEHTSFHMSQIDRTLTIKNFNRKYGRPAGIALANAADEYLCGMYKQFWISGGTPGTVASTFSALGDQATLFGDYAIPDDGDRKFVMAPRMRWALADALKGSFDPALARDTIRKGWLPQVANFELREDQNIVRHTTGSRTNTALDCLVKGANQHSNASPQANTQSLIIDDDSGTTSTFLEGDVFTIANVNAVNPVSKLSTGRPQQFVVRANATAVASEATLTIAPAIVTTGPYQNVDAAPADDAGLTFLGAASTVYAQNLAFHMNAIALAVVPIELPSSAPAKARASSPDGNISLAMVQDFDIDNYDEVTRFDVLFGAIAQYPHTGSRLWGSSTG